MVANKIVYGRKFPSYLEIITNFSIGLQHFPPRFVLYYNVAERAASVKT